MVEQYVKHGDVQHGYVQHSGAMEAGASERRATKQRSVVQKSRVKLWVGILSAIALLAFVIIPSATAQSEPPETVSYTVQPHQTLWDYASEVTPAGGDIYDTMEQIKQLNHMDTDQLITGQTLLVPQE
ncbi:LysM peptidoglycan-binding domain-containing protein [Alloscardovia criceti]|uniref:LysM peptidoglycan-binding domain-containing protein n=1 Tax=Alloscardovia criceti TaxID=356828 RepID=UPI00036DB7F7|nr:LysM peptidoglycan-binding domain-containing protein [Alloscardovia criceti]